jgi:hypothetical protein
MVGPLERALAIPHQYTGGATVDTLAYDVVGHHQLCPAGLAAHNALDRCPGVTLMAPLKAQIAYQLCTLVRQANVLQFQ